MEILKGPTLTDIQARDRLPARCWPRPLTPPCYCPLQCQQVAVFIFWDVWFLSCCFTAEPSRLNHKALERAKILDPFFFCNKLSDENHVTNLVTSFSCCALLRIEQEVAGGATTGQMALSALRRDVTGGVDLIKESKENNGQNLK